MAQYLLSVHGEDSDFDPAAGKYGAYASAEEPEAAMAAVVDGTGDTPVFTDGPYLETKERIGGFWVINAPNLDVALQLAAEGSNACRGKVEVRPFAG